MAEKGFKDFLDTVEDMDLEKLGVTRITVEREVVDAEGDTHEVKIRIEKDTDED